MDDLRVEMLPSLSSINLVRKAANEDLSINSNYHMTPMKLNQAGSISDTSTTGTGMKHQFGSETASNDADSLPSKLSWYNKECYPQNRKPMFM